MGKENCLICSCRCRLRRLFFFPFSFFICDCLSDDRRVMIILIVGFVPPLSLQKSQITHQQRLLVFCPCPRVHFFHLEYSEFVATGGSAKLITTLLPHYYYLLMIYLPALTVPLICSVEAHSKLQTAGLPLPGRQVLFHSVQMGDDDIRTEIGRGDHSTPPIPFDYHHYQLSHRRVHLPDSGHLWMWTSWFPK